MFAPVSYMLEKMAGDEAWATQRWGHDGSGYRFDVLAAVMLKRVEASDGITRTKTYCERTTYFDANPRRHSVHSSDFQAVDSVALYVKLHGMVELGKAPERGVWTGAPAQAAGIAHLF